MAGAGRDAKWQASINPKAETVEELQARRKNLHMGMCKLLKEDLVLIAESKLDKKPNLIGIMERVIQDFDHRTQQHSKVGAAAFNNDAEYKLLMNQAIDGKAYALDKLDMCLEAILDPSVLNRILDAPLEDFANQAAVLRLRTGVTELPWAEIVLERKADLDFGEWDAASVSAKVRELVAGALGSNPNVRTVLVKGVRLALNDGWTTTEIEWCNNAAVKALTYTASLVLRNCSCLLILDARSLMYLALPLFLTPSAHFPVLSSALSLTMQNSLFTGIIYFNPLKAWSVRLRWRESNPRSPSRVLTGSGPHFCMSQLLGGRLLRNCILAKR
jgi:hypothetical protein